MKITSGIANIFPNSSNANPSVFLFISYILQIKVNYQYFLWFQLSLIVSDKYFLLRSNWLFSTQTTNYCSISYSNYTIKLVNISTATLDYMRTVRTVFCPDFLAQYKSIPLWRSTVFGWTALDPVLTQNGIGTGRAGWKQWKIRRANGGKKHKSEPKWLRFCFETTYGPEGRGFESLTAYQKSSKSSDFEDFCFL